MVLLKSLKTVQNPIRIFIGFLFLYGDVIYLMNLTKGSYVKFSSILVICHMKELNNHSAASRFSHGRKVYFQSCFACFQKHLFDSKQGREKHMSYFQGVLERMKLFQD